MATLLNARRLLDKMSDFCEDSCRKEIWSSVYGLKITGHSLVTDKKMIGFVSCNYTILLQLVLSRYKLALGSRLVL